MGMAEDDMLSEILAYFYDALLAPQTLAHINLLKKATEEGTSENVQMVEMMREQQREAYWQRSKD